MTATKKKLTTTAIASMESPNTRPSRSPYNRMVQNFLLVWLDAGIDEQNYDDCRNSIAKLRQFVNTVKTFTDADECIDFITDIKEENIFIIISGTFSSGIVPVVQDMLQVSCVYILCKNKRRYEQWALQWSKVKGVYTDITPIYEVVKQATHLCDQNMVSISFIKSSNETSTQNLDQLDQSFMYTQILKEILLTIDFEQKHIEEFLIYCREQFATNTTGLRNVDKLQEEYRLHKPIWWYTSDGFLYSMLNRALRVMEVDLIIKMGFFVRDLHNHIAALHLEQYNGYNQSNSFTLYRGQGLAPSDFDQLMKTKGGLMSFNNFLSTSRDQAVSFAFAASNASDPNLIGILFEITVDPSIPSTPFANISDVSYFKMEEEILFSMHSVFRIRQVKQLDEKNRVWKVDLTLTSDNDPQLHNLSECMQKETRGSTGWHRLVLLLMKLGHFNKAEELHEILLQQATDEGGKAHVYHTMGLIKNHQGQYAEAIEFYEKSIKIKQKILSPTDPSLATSYNNIGGVYDDMGEYSKALSYYEKALEILQKTLPPNHLDLATSYNNIGSVYKNMGEYSKALSYYEKTLEIYQKTLPPNHPSLATSYNNIGLVYDSMGEYSKALSYYEKALDIFQKTLPSNHPDLATSYSNIGLVYDNRGEYSKALSYYEKALEIREKTLPPNHPDLATSYNNIGGVYNNMGEYSKALSYYGKALEIIQKTLPPTHPSLASSYNNIGLVYGHMGEHSKALSYHEKALEIFQKTLPPNHPDLATSHNNIGLVYGNMGEYSKALTYYEKALEFLQKTLPPNHSSLASSYNNIGGVYENMGEYSKALLYYEKALEIKQKTLPLNHSSLATSYNNIGGVYENMGEYSKVLSYYEKALEIFQKTLPPNHSSLATSYNNIGGVYDDMGEYSKALSYCEKALEIRQKSLSPNHPDLATSYNNIGGEYYNMGEYSKALSFFERAFDIQQRSLPANHPNLQSVRINIETLKKKL
jgi:tetratricopeptide (TPR) repeat protein